MAFFGKRAIVTGAGRGIGKDIALHLAASGVEVIAISQSLSSCESLKSENSQIEVIAVDLGNWDATKLALDILEPVDYLVNNCGTNFPEPFLEVTEEHFNKIVDVNYKSTFIVSQCVIKKMVESGRGGAIVNMSSQASQRHIVNHAAYSSSKAAVEQLTKFLAADFGKHKIRVNCVSPTVVMTDLGRRDWSDPAKAGPMLQRIPAGRFAETSDVVSAVVYLLSDESKMITGAILPVDGGFWTT